MQAYRECILPNPPRWSGLLLGALAFIFVAPADGESASTGMLMQLTGTAACVSEHGSGNACTDGNALSDAYGVTVSPDGRHVYVASFVSGAVAAFSRKKRTGALTPLAGMDGCASVNGTDG